MWVRNLSKNEEMYPDHGQQRADGAKNSLCGRDRRDILREVQGLNGGIQRRDGCVFLFSFSGASEPSSKVVAVGVGKLRAGCACEFLRKGRQAVVLSASESAVNALFRCGRL